MYHYGSKNLYVWLLLTLTLLLVGCSWSSATVTITDTTRKVAATKLTVTDMITSQVLMNMHLHAWNPQAMTHSTVTGGLFINWKMSDPTVTNVTNPGPDGNAQHDHDPQVDLLYLTSLLEYQQIHPNDHTYDSDLQRIMNVVLIDFRKYSLPKGWIYFYVLKSGMAAHNTALIDEAHTIASNFYTRWYDPRLGFVYNRTHSSTESGDYNVDHTLACGAALIDAGLRWNQPNWVIAGKKTIDHVLSVALDAYYHLFYYSMTVNTDSQDTIENYKAKPVTQGQAVDALLMAYTLTHYRPYLLVAGQVLTSLFGSSGLWDSKRGGFFFALDMQTYKVLTDYKETRGQSLTLLAVHHYNQLKLQQFVSQEQQLLRVLTDHFYEATYHGYFYRLTPDFHIYVTHPGQGAGVEDYFTTEAMGGALDALQQVELAL